jgi:hypothetical protein
MSEQLSTDELKRILIEKRPKEFPGRITVDNSISPDIYAQCRAAGLIDEDGFETF